MNDVTMQTPTPLLPPIVDIADPEDGLLMTRDLNAPISVGVVVWEAARPDHYIQLMLDNSPVGDTKAVADTDKPGDIIKVDLSENLLVKNGVFRLSYRVTSRTTEFSNLSPCIPLKTDREAPGAALLAPLIVPAFTFGDRLKALLPGYAGMEPGDVIRTVCNGVDGPSHTVQADELTLRPVEIDFERELLQGLAAEHASIEYFVTDRAGNSSVMAPSVLVSLQV